MNGSSKFDICVIGAGAGGLSVAAAAAQMGASVVLVEAGRMGGDCLNYGCVPSKSLLAAAKVAHQFQIAEKFGIQSAEPQIDFEKVMAHVNNVIKTISVHDSVERFTKLGVSVIQAQGKFIDSKTLQAGEKIIQARRFVIATGSSPSVPPIPGLAQANFYTNETIFNIKKKPEHLLIIGGGPIGCELAQAFLLLGSKVTILEAFHILPHDESDLVDILRNHLSQEGVDIRENVKITEINSEQNQIKIIFEKNDKSETISGTDLLVATGRRANIEELNLDAAGVRYNKKGVEVDSRLRTSNKHIYAIGDVAGGFQFTHIANYHAEIVIRNILFRLPTKVDYRAVPWVTFTEPELAHVGLTSSEAQKLNSKNKILMADFSENDRAQTERNTLGKIKVITSSGGKILGVSILGPQAGELIVPWISAIQNKKSIRHMINFIIPYPTLSEISKKVAGVFYTPILFSKRTKKLVRFLNLFG